MSQPKSQSELYFRPRARLLVLLGEQLIKNEIVAVSELVKNAYDADATKVVIGIRNVGNPDTAEIIVQDNGTGMSERTVLDVWMEPATSYRAKQRQSMKVTKLDRRTLGQKGIGRFAAHKLGNQIELVTRHSESDTEVVLDVDWSIFTEDAYLDSVPVRYKTRPPQVFVRGHGTRIRVTSLNSKWTPKMVKDLKYAIQGLTSPFEEIADFSVGLDAPEFADMLDEIPPLSEVVSDSPYRFRAECGADGQATITYGFHSSSHPDLDHNIGGKGGLPLKVDLAALVKKRLLTRRVGDDEIQMWDRLECGPFSIRLNVWDIDPKDTFDSRGGKRYYDRVIRPQTGIRVYRDRFRVWPYGEEKDDWLGMDLRRVNNFTKCISRNQVIGLIEISDATSPELRDKTNREGLVENTAFKQFATFVVELISLFEIERLKDRKKLNALRTKRMPQDSVVRIIDRIKEKVVKRSEEDAYGHDLAALERAYKTRIDELLGPYLLQASLGIAYSIPIHELRRDASDLRTALEPIRSKAEEEENAVLIGQLSEVLNALRQIELTVDGVRNMLRKTTQQTFNLSGIARDAISIVTPRAQREHVKCSLSVRTDSKVTGDRHLLIAAVLNLLDNSMYWVGFGADEKRIEVLVDKVETDGGPWSRLIVTDNGPGFQDAFEDAIQPFFTRKPDGSGLGLHIVDTIMKSHNGAVVLLERGEFSTGASVALLLPGESDQRIDS